MLYLEEEKLFMLKGDMHIHTEYSDGDVMEKVLAEVLKKGFDFISITDHDTTKGMIVAEELLKEMNTPLTVIPGNEITAPGCHLLAYGIKSDIINLGTIKEITERIRKQGGYVCAAHPHWSGTKKEFWDTGVFHGCVTNNEVDGIELINHSANLCEDGDDIRGNLPVINFYENLKTNGTELAVTVGSDAHIADKAGRVCMYVFAENNTSDRILNAIFKKNMAIAFWRGKAYGSDKALALWEKYSELQPESERDTISHNSAVILKFEKRANIQKETTSRFFEGNRLCCDTSDFPVLQIWRDFGKPTQLNSYKLSDGRHNDDVEASFAPCWDKEFLKFRILVEDKFFYQPYTNVLVYIGDSIQLGIDPKCRRSRFALKEKTVFEFSLALTKNGPMVINNLVPSWLKDQLDIQPCLTVEKNKNVFLYNFNIPWKLIGIEPKAGIALGFNLIVNVNDGNGRRGWIEWTPGIGDRKCADDWGCMVLNNANQ